MVPSEKPGALRVRGVHYSTARRPALDGRYFGTGLKGAERARLQDLPKDSPLRSRVLAYVDEGSGIRPEQGVGNVPTPWISTTSTTLRPTRLASGKATRTPTPGSRP